MNLLRLSVQSQVAEWHHERALARLRADLSDPKESFLQILELWHELELLGRLRRMSEVSFRHDSPHGNFVQGVGKKLGHTVALVDFCLQRFHAEMDAGSLQERLSDLMYCMGEAHWRSLAQRWYLDEHRLVIKGWRTKSGRNSGRSTWQMHVDWGDRRLEHAIRATSLDGRRRYEKALMFAEVGLMRRLDHHGIISLICSFLPTYLDHLNHEMQDCRERLAMAGAPWQ